jgi:acyl-ACP thioesterase
MQIYTQNFLVDELAVDTFGRLKQSMLLYYLQEVAGKHFALLEDPNDPIAGKNFFWAVSRHRFEILSLPRLGDTITVETSKAGTKIRFLKSAVRSVDVRAADKRAPQQTEEETGK